MEPCLRELLAAHVHDDGRIPGVGAAPNIRRDRQKLNRVVIGSQRVVEPAGERPSVQ